MKKVFTILICLCLLISAAAISAALIITAPKAEKSDQVKTVPLVETMPLQSSNEILVLEAAGAVLPAEEVILRARINSEVAALHPEFIEGGMVHKNDTLLTLDPQDYELALAQARSSLEQARLALALEKGQQDIARREWAMLDIERTATDDEEALALRIPHLQAREAALEAAEAAYKKAEINLERTQIKAPFNAVVTVRNVNIGSQASVQDILGGIAGTDAFWIKASIPVDRLPLLHIPGSEVSAVSVSGAAHRGTVVRRMAQLTKNGRMAQVLIEVDDPLCLTPEKKDIKPLLLGEYVRLSIQGDELQQVFRIPRKALREGDTIWIATAENTLSIRTVNIRWRDSDSLLIDGPIKDGERLIVSALTAPIDGIELQPENGSEAR
ncbi:MAG: efflux RND transporter periplasmic adaptor subunit [Pontiellaceae bacterium]|nr:efflux RND transporter periplasmic adaptor subunit [Pontiellaceae bacterium]MBN2785656.1 efflux RND transporter periplasmic adaptor subunit [Pontiellaceae bacterium]